MDSIRIERVKLKDLEAVAARFVDGAAPGTFIPITKHRAAAMAHNPHAQPDDVALLLATQGERCVGYFGLAAMQLAQVGQLHRVHWLTTWAVSRDMLGKGLGSRLMEEAIALDVDLAIVGSKPARRVSAKYGFSEVKPLDYVQLDFGLAGRYNPLSLLLRGLRKLASLVGLRLPVERVAGFFERLFETLLGRLVRPVAFWLVRRTLPGTGAQHGAPLAAATNFVVAPPSETGFYRDAAVLSWMIAHPWVLPNRRSSSSDLAYEFTDWRPGFEIFGYGNAQDYALFQFSRIRGQGVLKVLDHTLAPAALLALALRVAGERGAGLVEGPAELAAALSGVWRSLLLRRKQRTLQVHPRSAGSPLAAAWPQLVQHYTDGDMAFT
jgi:GNAT superfamily N-acetyltransferase